MAAFPGTLVCDYHSYAAIAIPANTIRDTQNNVVIRLEQDAFPSDMLDADATFSSGDYNGYRKGCMLDGRDLRFFSDSGLTTQINHRVLYVDLDNTPANSVILVDVQLPSIGVSAKTIYVAWGQVNTFDEEETDTYYSNWQFMQHGKWNDDDDEIIDYGQNGRNGTPKSSSEPTYNENSTYPYYTNTYDGTDDYSTIPSFDTGAYFTVFFRARFDGTSSGWERIVSKKENYADTDGFEINRVDGQTERIEILGSSTTKVEYDLTDIDDGNWHTVAVVFYGTGVECFLDGVKLSKYSGSTITSITNNSHQIGIGDNSNQSEAEFNGDLADIWLVTVQLSDSQVEFYTTMLNDPGGWTSKVTPSPGGAPSSGSRVAIDPYTKASVVVDNVQRGNYELPDGDVTVDETITAIDLTKTMLVATHDGKDTDADDWLLSIGFLDTTTIRADREGDSEDVNIEYQAIEFSAGVKVEHHRVQRMTGTELIITLTSDFDRNNSFIMINHEVGSTSYGSEERISAEFITPRKIRILRQSSDTDTWVSIQAVRYDGCVVRAFNFDEDGNATSEVETIMDGYPDFDDYTKVMLVGSVRNQESNSVDGDNIWRMEVTSASSITMRRWASSNPLNTCRIFAVEFTDSTTVKQYLNTITSGDTESQTLSPTVDSDYSAAFPASPEVGGSAFASDTGDDDGGDLCFSTDLTSDSNVDQVRYDSTSDDAYLGFWIVEFPTSAVVTGHPWFYTRRRG